MMTDNLYSEKPQDLSSKTSANSNAAHKTPQKENMLTNILMNIVIPTLILMKLSGDTFMGHPWGLGPKWALIIALGFPIAYGVKDFLTHRKFNVFSALGIISVLLTGGISLFHLDTKYYAMKEAALPALIGLVFIISTKTRYPLVKTFLYNDKILNVEKISALLEERGNQKKFEKTLRNGSYIFAASYFIFAALNYVIAKMIVVSATGTPEFNVEIGKMHVVSFVVITLPSMIFLAVTLYYIFRDIKLFTGLSFEEAMHDSSNS